MAGLDIICIGAINYDYMFHCTGLDLVETSAGGGDEVRLTGGRPPPHSPAQTRTRSKRAREGKGTTGEITAGDTAAPPWTIGGG